MFTPSMPRVMRSVPATLLQEEYLMTHYPLVQFVNDVDVVVRRESRPPLVVQQVRPLLQRLLARRDWLDNRYCQPVPGKPYTQYLLHTPPDDAWSVVAFV